jgi:hypothetical protein
MLRIVTVGLALALAAGMLPTGSPAFSPEGNPFLEPHQVPFNVSPGAISTGQPFPLVEYVVPEDRTFVIEFASVLATFSQAPDTVLLLIETVAGGTTSEYPVALSPIFDSGFSTFAASEDQPLRIYADPGTTVRVKGLVLSACADEPCSVSHRFAGSISGQLVRGTR